MPRKVRELVDGGIYHLYNRRNNGEKLYLDKEDYEYFRFLLRRAKEKFPADIYHYCLMMNHYHILLKVRVGEDLGRLMHSVQLGYARHYKQKYRRKGHVFQERFRSPRIDAESYYLQCGRYIERNPLRAKIVTRAEAYGYSSAAYYVHGKKDPLITANMYYQGMGKTLKERQMRYRQFVSLGEPYSAIIEAALKKV